MTDPVRPVADSAAAPVQCAASPADRQLEKAEFLLGQIWALASGLPSEICNAIRDPIHHYTKDKLRATGEGARDDREEQNNRTADMEVPALRKADRHLRAHGRGNDHDDRTDDRRESGTDLDAHRADPDGQVAVSLDPHRHLEIERVVDRCIREHGGFRHGNHVGFCESCRREVDAARLRGGATVRPVEDDAYRVWTDDDKARMNADLLKPATVRVEE